MEENYSTQVAVITYPKEGASSNFVRFHVEAERSKGHVIVFCDGYARVHQKKVKK